MKTTQFQWMGQMLAALGVIISLCLVAYEMKLAREIAMADLLLQRNLAVLESRNSFLESDLYIEARKQQEARQPLDFRQRSAIVGSLKRTLLVSDIAYYHHELGLLPDGQWQAYVETLLTLFQVEPLMSEAWNEGASYREPFVDQIESIRSSAASQIRSSEPE